MRQRKPALFATFVGLLWAIPVHGLTTIITRTAPSQPVTNSTNISFEFTSTAADASFVCALDYADPVPCTSPWSYHGLSDGHHHFRVHAISVTEGTDYTGDAHQWRVDTVWPMTKLSATPVRHDSYRVDLQSNESPVTFLCSLDGAAAVPCTTPHVLGGLSAGNHYFRAQAVDEAGNIDPNGDDFSITIQTPPAITTTITSVVPLAEFTNQTGVIFDFVSNTAGASFRCTLGGITSACAPPRSYQSLPDGFYTFTVHAEDAFGNSDPVGDSHSWTVDTVPPQGQGVRLEATSTTITVSWTSNEPANTALNWGLEADVSRAVPVDSAFALTHSVRITGLSSNTVYSVQPSGVDRAGNFYRMPRLTVRTKR